LNGHWFATRRRLPWEVYSASTYELIKNRFDCTHRGKLKVKNLSDLDMYYVENEKTQTDMPELSGVSKEEFPLLRT
jgi:hypothetical protein